MNETQLHVRLSDLADELAPDADPYAQVSGARTLHRRQRRTRIGVAGAAVAVAAVVIGVPTALNTLSASPGEDAAGPSSSLPVEGPEGAAEDLRQFVDTLQAGLGGRGVDGALPDPEAGFPCPDAADALGVATGMYVLEPAGINAGGSTLTGCAWSTDESQGTAERRLDVSLSAAFDATTDSVLRELDDRVAEDGCAWTTVPGETLDTLLRCEGPQTTWTLTMVDEDGTGAWVLRSAVGSDLPEAFGTATGTLAELWRIVEDGGATTPADPGAPTDQRVVEQAERIADAYPDMSAVPVVRDPFCPATPAQLVRSGFGGQPAGSLVDGCVWTADVRDSMPATGSIRFTSDPVLDSIACPTATIPGWAPTAELKGCRMGETTAWTLLIPAYDGSRTWVVTASGGVADVPDGEATTLEDRGPSSGALLTTLVGLVPTR